jgi:hypothetical protein
MFMTDSAGTTFSASFPWSTIEAVSLVALVRPEDPGFCFFLPLFTFTPPIWRALSVVSAELNGSIGKLSTIYIQIYGMLDLKSVVQ